LNLTTGEPFLPSSEGIWDSVSVKRQVLNLSTILSTQLLLVDEVMKAGKSMGQAQPPPGGMEDME
jgi:T-complex protein 1 subunit zeta